VWYDLTIMAALNPQALAQTSIYDAARSCSELFAFHAIKDGICETQTLRVEELHGLFDQWAAYAGAFAMPKASLDARLQDHQDIKSMVLELLSVVQLNLRWGKNCRRVESSAIRRCFECWA
jgi:hypothetical protein